MIPAIDRRSPDRVSGHDLWLDYNRLQTYVACLEVLGDSMRNIIEAIEPGLPTPTEWQKARAGSPRRKNG